MTLAGQQAGVFFHHLLQARQARGKTELLEARSHPLPSLFYQRRSFNRAGQANSQCAIRLHGIALRSDFVPRAYRSRSPTPPFIRISTSFGTFPSIVLAPENPHGKRLRKRYGKVRGDLFTFLIHPEVPPDNNPVLSFAEGGSERELRPTATYRKVTGGFRSDWGADLFAAVRSVVGTAGRNGVDAYAAILNTLRGQAILAPG